MQKTGKILVGLCAMPILVITGYLGLLSVVAWQKDFTWTQMDWNADGSTSLSEFIQTSDVGRRYELVNGKECTVYFAYKDGSAIRKDCETGV